MYFGSETQDLTTTLNSELQLLPSLPLQPTELAIAGLPYALKRMIDMLGALIGMLLLSPVMLGVAILIRFDSPGPILFRQLRRGRHGRTVSGTQVPNNGRGCRASPAGPGEA